MGLSPDPGPHLLGWGHWFPHCSQRWGAKCAGSSVCSWWGCRAGLAGDTPETSYRSIHMLACPGCLCASSLVSSHCEAGRKPTRVRTGGQNSGLTSSQCPALRPCPGLWGASVRFPETFTGDCASLRWWWCGLHTCKSFEWRFSQRFPKCRKQAHFPAIYMVNKTKKSIRFKTKLRPCASCFSGWPSSLSLSWFLRTIGSFRVLEASRTS